MRRILYLLILIPGLTLAQDYPPYEQLYLPLNEGEIKYQEVIQAPETSQSELYTRAKLWFADAFKTSEHVIELDSKDDGIIIGNGNAPLLTYGAGVPVESTLYFTITIEVKDGRSRYTIDNLVYKSKSYAGRDIETFFSREWMYKKNGKPKRNMFGWYEVYEEQILALEASIKDAMTKSATSDW